MSSLKYAAEIANPYALMAAAVIGVLALAGLVLRRKGLPSKQRDRVLLYSFLLVVFIALLLFAPGLIESLTKDQVKVRRENTHIDLSVRNESLKRILQRCADQAGLALALDPKFDGSATMTLQSEGKLSGILDNVCEVGNCVWQIEPGPQPVLFIRAAETKPQAP